ncbi:uncharacterized protein F5891DRAFT_1182607 [Suillus fuscotomentosus]|uniref:Uncharacterized protein n=1 Tax=Suillus fuscotomentosus TaxID=1912939 RepID=A0AAD4HQH4_9AGAM|nr:uncharacterized protein F5891DRAFT_1182607 [Suillus fuscotomentosus]KAG1906360.1 hypothetical protein F5891DRAFT_1182607 [Suillus fuscotomentosus]
MSANAGIDRRPITICVTSDILAMGADHLKDKEEEFSSDRNNANDPRFASWGFCPISTLLTTQIRCFCFALDHSDQLQDVLANLEAPPRGVWQRQAPAFYLYAYPGHQTHSWHESHV